MSEYQLLQVDGEESGLRVLTMNRPPVNALGRDLVRELTSAFEILRDDAEARCLIVRSGVKHFCAGADLKERQTMSLEDVREFVPRLAGACNAAAAVPYPTVAALHGAVAGGGCELALACDFRIVADSTTIGLRETALAIIPGGGGTQRLSRLIGPARAKRWICSARMYSADDAFADGVADQVVSADRLEDEARELAQAISANGPQAVRLAKSAIDRGAHLPLDEALELEWALYQETLESEDRAEALVAFAEKRKPKFLGR
jgi:methylglutaconyl-CoA hydratase